jgi:hypothetical protein
MSDQTRPDVPPEPGTLEAAKKLKDHNESSVYGALTDQAAGRRPDGSIEESSPRPGQRDGAGVVSEEQKKGGAQ